MSIRVKVMVPPDNGYQTPELMKRVEDDLQKLRLGSFTKEDGLPRRREDGNWEVWLEDPFQFNPLTAVLEGCYGFETEME